MAQSKYRYIEDFIDLSTGRAEIYDESVIDPVTHRVKKKSVINNELQSPRLVDTRNFGKVLLHRIAKIEYEIADDSGRKIVIEKKGKKGGWVESYQNLSQLGDSWISDNAVVLGKALVSGNAQISGSAEIGDDAMVMDDASVTGQACVRDNSCVYGSASISGGDRVAVGGNAMVKGSVSGTSRVGGTARVRSSASVSDNARVGGRSTVYGKVTGNAVVMGDAFVDGIVSGNAVVLGTAIIDKSSTVTGDSFVDGGNIFGTISSKAKIGTDTMSYGTIKRPFALNESEYEIYKKTMSEKSLIKIRDDNWKLVKKELDQLYALPGGLKYLFYVKTRNSAEEVSEQVRKEEKEKKEREEKRKEEGTSKIEAEIEESHIVGIRDIADRNGISFSPVMFYSVKYGDRDKSVYVFSDVSIMNYFIKGELVYDLFKNFFYPSPVMIDGSVKCVIYGSTIIHPAGSVSETEIEITGNSQIAGTVKGEFHTINENSYIDGLVKGMYVTISRSRISGLVEGKNWRDITVSSKSGSSVSDLFEGKEGMIYGNFNVGTFSNSGSLVMPLEWQKDYIVFSGRNGFLLSGESVTTRKYKYIGPKRYGSKKVTTYLGSSAPSAPERFRPQEVDYSKIGDYYLDPYLNRKISEIFKSIAKDNIAYEKEQREAANKKKTHIGGQ